MYPAVRGVVDLERATDQLVDEIFQRLTAVHDLIDSSPSAPPPDEIRRRAAALVGRLTDAHPHGIATALTRSLWPPQPDVQIPASWWTTPLGQLVANALDPPSHRPLTSTPPVAPCHIAITIAESGRFDVEISGEIDVAAAALIDAQLQPHLHRNIHVDLRGVTFIDSTGLLCLLRQRAAADQHGGHITIGPISRVVERLLQLTGLDA
jgi:anti-sigma B factor antagonist